ncbi:TolC family protein [Algoriphagus sediminis]|nr:TolC family protein [Algoriphagus sediminis]
MRKLFIFIYCLSFSAPVFAVQDTLKMDFATAVNLALEANLDYQIQSNQQEVLKKEKQTALASHFPSVNVGTTFSRQSGQQFQQIEGEIVVTNVTNEIISGGLNLEMPLFNSGRRIFDTQSSKLAWEAGEMGLERAAQQVVFDVARRYLQVLLDKELLRIANENLENQKALLEQITGFTEAGLRTLADQYNQQSEVARVESTVVDAEIQYENDLWDLSEYLQLEPGVIPDIIEVDPAVNSMSYEGMSTVELYDIALGNRVDIKQQELLTNSAEKSLKANKAMYYPRLNAFYNYSTFFTSLDDRSIQEQLLTIYPQNNLGMRLSIPIFNNLNNRLNVTRSRVQLKNQELRKEALDRSIYQDVRLANQNYQAAIRKEKNTRVQVVAAEEAQTAVSERFRLGLSNFVDLSTANQQLVAAKGDAAQAIYTLFFQEVIMRHALGTLNPLGIE